MTKQERKVVYDFFIHEFLRRIGKRYPDFFNRWVADTTDNLTERRILGHRYTGDTQMKFPAIALTLGIDPSYMFRRHKNAAERLVFL